MPNWCSNELTITGLSARLEEFRQQAVGLRPKYKEREVEEKTNILQFNNFVPVPQELLDAGYDKGGYEWELEHWGVKWGACDVSIEDAANENVLQYLFNTPWKDPDKWLTKVAEDFPGLVFYLKYDEPGMGFCGDMKFKNGRLVAKTYTEYLEEEEEDRE